MEILVRLFSPWVGQVYKHYKDMSEGERIFVFP